MAKGDAAKLRADIDDGWFKYANLLCEACSCAPLGAPEFRVLNFVMRRTYGWVDGDARDSGKLDVITADEVSRGTHLSPRAAAEALKDLANARVLLRAATRAGGPFMYGVNSDLTQWGDKSSSWSEFRANLIASRDAGTFNRSGYTISVPPTEDEYLPPSVPPTLTAYPLPPTQKEYVPPTLKAYLPPTLTAYPLRADNPCPPWAAEILKDIERQSKTEHPPTPPEPAEQPTGNGGVDSEEKSELPPAPPSGNGSIHVAFANAIWAGFGLTIPRPGSVLKAATAFRERLGNEDCDKLLDFITAGNPRVPAGAEPGAYVAGEVKTWMNTKFNWAPKSKSTSDTPSNDIYDIIEAQRARCQQ